MTNETFEMKLYQYEWIDIDHDAQWWGLDELEDKLKKGTVPIKCVGYLVKKTDEFYIFSSGYDKSNKKFFDMVIYPKGVITTLTELYEK